MLEINLFFLSHDKRGPMKLTNKSRSFKFACSSGSRRTLLYPPDRLTAVGLALVLLSILSVSVLGQSALSTIRGTVLDPTGAVVPGVDITLTETATGVQARTSISDANGNFELPDLQPGTYRLSASLPGFKTFVAEDIVLESGQIRRININLEIGEATEEVTVEAGAAVITTESGTISGAVTSQQFKDVPQVDTIPYPGPQSLLSTLPGVQGQGWNVSIAGQQGNQITWEDDGVQNDRSGNQATNMNTYEEVRVVTVNNTADKSRAASFNSTSKRGSNALHGMA